MSHTIDSEEIHASELLYDLVDRMRTERAFWPTHARQRRTLTYDIGELTVIAHSTLFGVVPLDIADGYADAGEMILRRIIGERVTIHTG